ncbi:MAG: biotin carboxylase N-terminal domain-containing protein [Paracoccaceae bacterium]
MAAFDTILIANRGEIACRVIRTAQAMGLRCIAVYSEADEDAPHVDLADAAVLLGPAPAADSYLNAERLIEACRISGAQAVHPGYGFLSENADFARACASAGLIFVGPPPGAIELMGSKRQSKLAMIAAGVPCVPGYQGGDQSDDRLIDEAGRIGFPLMVKASAGGGGKGMRLVSAPDALPAALARARSEAFKSFGSDELILERALANPRHVEIQIFADSHGNAVHLGERDCSVQRRHQKVIEEAPSPAVTPELRAEMGAAAVAAARACGYCGAGTVEFLLGSDGAFHFLEMNTRLQVEHPVTEMVTGLDLVEWQLRVAAGEPLPLAQDDIRLDGWAMEARLYAEDPGQGFLPQTGRVLSWQPAQGPGVRVDAGIREGQEIGPHYDPMLAKIVAHGRTRDEARLRLARAVEDTVLLGVTGNKAFLAAILRHDEFVAARADTGFLGRAFAGNPTLSDAPPELQHLALAASLFHLRDQAGQVERWRNRTGMRWPMRLLCAGQTFELTVTEARGAGGACFTVRHGEAEVAIEMSRVENGRCVWIAGGLRRHLPFAFAGDTLYFEGPAGALGFRLVTHLAGEGAEVQGSGRITAPMDGSIVALHATPATG